MPAEPPPRDEVRLDPELQERLLAQMREEQAAAVRRRELTNWVLVPLSLVALVTGVVLSFSADLGIALVANLVASGVGYVLYRVNKERVWSFFGRS